VAGAHRHSVISLPTNPVSRALVGAAGACALATVVALVVLWPGNPPEVLQPLFGNEQVDATVTGIEPGSCGLLPGTEAETAPATSVPEVSVPLTEDDLPETEDSGAPSTDQPICEDVSLRITSGPTAGDEPEIQVTPSAGTPRLRAGDRIVVGYDDAAEPGFEYYFADYQRRGPLLVLAALFAASVLLLGWFKGLRALLGAAVSLVALATFLLPALLSGDSPLLVALVTASAVAFAAIYLAHGLNHQSTVAYLGTAASLLLTGVLASIFVEASQFSGLADEEATFLQISAGQVDLAGLLLAGIVIGTLGVLDDVTVTQVSAVWELRHTDPGLSPRRLYGSALRIGRDHIASTVNTLVLAYAGASLPLLLLFSQSGQPVDDVLNGEVVAVEVVRALVGSIGLVAAVPITTALAVLAVTRTEAEPADDRPDEGDEDEDGEGDAGSADDGVIEDDVAEEEPEAPRAYWDDFGPRQQDF